LWSESSYADWEKGVPDGVAIGSDGVLQPGPHLQIVARLDATDVWAVASDDAGNAYVATGTPAQVVKVSPDGKQTVLFTTKDVSVQTLALGPDDALYVATLPSAKVFRIPLTARVEKPLDETTAQVVFNAASTTEKPAYIWAIRFDAQKRMYLATGGPGAIYRLAAGGTVKPELFFKSDEPHIRTMEFAPNGDLIAGSDGTGLVYRILPSGKATVLFEAQKREITALSFGAEGQVYVAAAGEKGRVATIAPLPAGSGSAATAHVTITVVQPGSTQSVNNNGPIQDGSEIYLLPAEAGHARMKVPGEVPRTLIAAHEDVIYAMRSTPEGLLLATGNRGRIYRLQDDGTYADIGHADAGQVIGFAPAVGHSTSRAGEALYAVTANTGKLLRLTQFDGAAGQSSSLLSDIFDATEPSLWGRVEVLADSSANSYGLEVRTGNIDNPLRGWSDWMPVDPHAASDAPFADGARFAQWRLALKPGARIEQVALNYLPANAAPVVDEVLVVPGTRVNASAVQVSYPQQTTINFNSQGGPAVNLDSNSAAAPLSAIRDKSSITVRWAAHDDNNDDLRFSLYYRGEGAAQAGRLRTAKTPGEEAGWHLLKAYLADRYYSFDASLLPDGPYRIRVVASDAPSNPAGAALTGQHLSDLFLVDTATPAVESLSATLEASGLHITASAIDQKTPIQKAEYSIDASPWQIVAPVSGISDSLRESYNVTVAMPKKDPADAMAGHVVTLRVFDRYDNSGSAKVNVP
jgi:sugar lactone lactonase YvrE